MRNLVESVLAAIDFDEAVKVWVAINGWSCIYVGSV